MQQSVTLVAVALAAFAFPATTVAVDAVAGRAVAESAIVPPPSARSCANAFVLKSHTISSRLLLLAQTNSLEAIHPSLPTPIQLNLHLDTAINLLGPSLIIHSQLQHIPILERERPALCPRSTQPNMVQERPRAALRIPDEELARLVAPDFGMPARNDLGFERDAERVDRLGRLGRVVRAIGEPPDAQDDERSEVAVDGVKVEGTDGFEVGDEAEAVGRRETAGISRGGGCKGDGGGRGRRSGEGRWDGIEEGSRTACVRSKVRRRSRRLRSAPLRPRPRCVRSRRPAPTAAGPLAQLPPQRREPIPSPLPLSSRTRRVLSRR